MGVYIKDMEMPTSCYACMFFAQTDYWYKEDEADILSRCKRTGEETWESVNGYLPNCPLVPVPPHGRLIDADAIERNLLKMQKAQTGPCSHGVRKSRAVLRDAPTILPAEEE